MPEPSGRHCSHAPHSVRPPPTSPCGGGGGYACHQSVIMNEIGKGEEGLGLSIGMPPPFACCNCWSLLAARSVEISGRTAWSYDRKVEGGASEAIERLKKVTGAI